MQAVVLAAGQGTRIRAVGPSKPMVSVEGTALLERVIRNAMAGGVTEFIVVTGYNAGPLHAFISGLEAELTCAIRCVENKDWHLGNGRSALAARAYVGETFHLLMADHLVDPLILKKVRDQPLPSQGVRLGVDFRLQNPHVDTDDVTKVLCDGTHVNSIGKTLAAFNGFDTGVFWCTRGLFHAMDQSIKLNLDDSLSGGARVLASQGLMFCADIGDRTWIDVDTPAVLELAQQALCQHLDMVG